MVNKESPTVIGTLAHRIMHCKWEQQKAASQSQWALALELETRMGEVWQIVHDLGVHELVDEEIAERRMGNSVW